MAGFQSRMLPCVARLCSVVLVCALCAGVDGGADAGTPTDAGLADGGLRDGGVAADGGSESDGGGALDAGPIDSGLELDAGEKADAGDPDAGTVDAGAADAGAPDAGTADAGVADSGSPAADAGVADAGSFIDAGAGPPTPFDAGFLDSGLLLPPSEDGGSLDDGGPAADAGAAGPPLEPPFCEDVCVSGERLGRCSASGQHVPVACDEGESCVDDRCVADSAVLGVGCSCHGAVRRNLPLSLQIGSVGLLGLWLVLRRARRRLSGGSSR